MRTNSQYIGLLEANKDVLQEKFAIQSLTVFGSVARNEFTEGSDIDIFVQMPAQMFLVVGAKQYLESILQCSVDLVRDHTNLNPFLKKQIEKDGITIFRA
ncbi:MAG: nucleotidyltransferase family protein [Bacteroidales bacterium]|nr:nucleotidyltransferase family protein [Bacteroidales bacterium]